MQVLDSLDIEEANGSELYKLPRVPSDFMNLEIPLFDFDPANHANEVDGVHPFVNCLKVRSYTTGFIKDIN